MRKKNRIVPPPQQRAKAKPKPAAQAAPATAPAKLPERLTRAPRSAPHSPQIIVTLSPQGGLVAELPGHNGSRRQIPLQLEAAGGSLLRMLQAQGRGHSEHSVGLESAPTSAQIEHWERHATQPKPTCQFCLAEGSVAPTSAKQQLRRSITKHSNGVEVNYLQARGAAAVAKPLRKSAEEIGL